MHLRCQASRKHARTRQRVELVPLPPRHNKTHIARRRCQRQRLRTVSQNLLGFSSHLHFHRHRSPPPWSPRRDRPSVVAIRGRRRSIYRHHLHSSSGCCATTSAFVRKIEKVKGREKEGGRGDGETFGMVVGDQGSNSTASQRVPIFGWPELAEFAFFGEA